MTKCALPGAGGVRYKRRRSGFGPTRKDPGCIWEYGFHRFWGLASIRSQSMEVVLLYRCSSNGACCSHSGSQLFLFFIVDPIWADQYIVHLGRQVKSIFDHRDACGHKHPVGEQSHPTNHFSTGIAVSCSSVRNVVGVHFGFPVLYHPPDGHGIPTIVVQQLTITRISNPGKSVPRARIARPGHDAARLVEAT